MNDSVEFVTAFLNCVCEILSYGEITGSTWEETFAFLHEKVRHERNRFTDAENIQIGKRLSCIFASILCEDTIWKYSYGGNNYQKMKYTVSNAFMLIRIWQNAFGIDMNSRPNVFAENRIDMQNIAKSNILADWNWMFQRFINVPPHNKKILIGQNCTFRNVSFGKKCLEGERFEYSSFEKISFEQDILKDTVLKTCRFVNGTSFAEATLFNVDFSGSILENVNFFGATLHDCSFYGATIINGNFNACTIENCLFTEATMKEVDWSCAKVEKISLNTVVCEHCNFDHTNLKERDAIVMEPCGD